MIKENSVSKYLLYAIGEIILVVIGILIALSINNWNENNKNYEQETIILISLQNELIENQKLLNKVINLHLQNAGFVQELSQKIKPEAKEIESTKFNLMLAIIMTPDKYEPSLGVLNGIISSGDLTLISNLELKYKLTSLIRHIESYNYWHEISYDKHILIDYPFIKTRYPIKNIAYGGDIKNADKSNFKVNQLSLLTSFEFESIVDLNYVNSMNLHNKAKEIYAIQNELLQLIKSNLPE